MIVIHHGIPKTKEMLNIHIRKIGVGEDDNEIITKVKYSNRIEVPDLVNGIMLKVKVSVDNNCTEYSKIITPIGGIIQI